VFVRLRSRCRAWRHRAAFERDTHDELRFHIERRVADLVAGGLPPEIAQRQARLEFGNPAACQDRCRDARGLRLLDDFSQDIRFAFRAFRHHTLLSAIVVLTLTFGIGVSSGVFTLFSAIALRPMIDADPSTFVRIHTTSAEDRARLKPFAQASLEEYVAFREGVRSVRVLSAQSRFSAPLGGDDAPVTSMSFASCNLFEVYGPVKAVLGRLLQPADCDAAAPVLVLSHTLWRTRFGTDPGVIGRTLMVRGVPLTVIGVAPRIATGPGITYAWLPYTLRAQLRFGDDPRRMIDGHFGHDRWLIIAGRLAPGATREQVSAELSVIAARQDRLHPRRVTAIAVTDGAFVHDPAGRGPAISIVCLVMGALTCLMLIACANVATLLLSRADARQQEVAVRLSLGAGRGRLLRMLLTETLTLAACAGAGSLYLAWRLPVALATWLIGTTPELLLVPDWRVFTYLAAAVCVAGVAAGLAPALESMRADVLDALKGQRSTLGPAVSATRFRAGLVAVQVGLSFVLLVGAALFLITHYATVRRDVGMETAQVLTPTLTYRAAAGSTAPPADAVFDALTPVPGVQSVVFAAAFPIGELPKIEIGSRDSGWRTVYTNQVSPGFFEALDIEILRGRAIGPGDPPCGTQPCPAVVSEAFVSQVQHGSDPIGVVLHTKTGGTLQVVGVARDTMVRQLNTPDPPQVYTPWTASGPSHALVRFAGDAAGVGQAVTAALHARFPGTILNVATLRAPIESWLDEVGRIETLVVALGGTAVALAALGVFGVVSFAVSRRRHEIGIRLALGAARRDIYSTVVGGALPPVAVGLVCGVALAVATAVVFGRLLIELRFAVSPKDPLTYLATASVLLAVIAVALLVPARRAAAINPLVALRYE